MRKKDRLKRIIKRPGYRKIDKTMYIAYIAIKLRAWKGRQ